MQVKYLGKEDSLTPWSSALDVFGSISSLKQMDVLRAKDAYENFRAWVFNLMMSHYLASNGFSSSPEYEDEETKMILQEMYLLACITLEQMACQRNARNQLFHSMDKGFHFTTIYRNIRGE